MHILSKIEEQTLLKTRLLNAEKEASFFISKYAKKPVLPVTYKIITRLFLMAHTYNAMDVFPISNVIDNLNDEKQLLNIARSFRRSVQKYKNEIRRIVDSGLDIRSMKRPTYPSFFNDRDRIYLKINPVSSAFLYLKNIIASMNEYLPENERLSVVKKDNTFLVQMLRDKKVSNQTLGTRAGRFLKKESAFISDILNKMDFFLSDAVQNDFINFLNQTTTYQEYLNTYPIFKDKHSTIFARALLTRQTFYWLKHQGEFKNVSDLRGRLQDLRNFYLKSFSFMQQMQTAYKFKKQKDEVIDMFIISKVPHDIAMMSAYAEYSKDEWASCMLPDGLNAHYLPKEIGNGVFVAFGINSQNPARRISRINIKPYLNNKGDVYYGLGYMYGEMMPEAYEALKEFLSPYQPELKGCFMLNNAVYNDAVTDRYFFNMDEEKILSHYDLSVTKDMMGNLTVGEKQDDDFSIINRSILLAKLLLSGDKKHKLYLDVDGVEDFVSFKNYEMNLDLTCYHLRKSRLDILPKHVDTLELIMPSIHNFKDVKSSFYALSVHLTNRLMGLEGLPTSCYMADLTRVKIKTPIFKIPKQLKSFVCGIVDLDADTLDMQESNGSIEWHESDISKVKRFMFSQNGGAFILFFTRVPEQMDMALNKIKKLYFTPVNSVEFTSFSYEALDELQLTTVSFKTKYLDLSRCKNIIMYHSSFEQVQELKLPKDTKILLENCTFPKGVELDDVLRDGGFSLKQVKVASQKKEPFNKDSSFQLIKE